MIYLRLSRKHKHGGESSDFIILKIADICQNPSIQVTLSLIFPLLLIQICMEIEADTPEK